MKEHATVSIRLGLGVVFGWFGVDKFIHPEAWFKWVPAWVSGIAPVPPNMMMYAQGGLEVLIALFLVLGLFTRVIAVIASVLLAGIILSSGGIHDITIRDLGLFSAALSLAFSGASVFSIDRLRKGDGDKPSKIEEDLL